MQFSRGYLEGQISILATILEILDDKIDLLVDNVSILKKNGARTATRAVDAQIMELDQFRTRIINAQKELVRSRKWQFIHPHKKDAVI